MKRIALVMFDTEKTSYSGVHPGERCIALLFVLYHLGAKMHQINIISVCVQMLYMPGCISVDCRAQSNLQRSGKCTQSGEKLKVHSVLWIVADKCKSAHTVERS